MWLKVTGLRPLETASATANASMPKATATPNSVRASKATISINRCGHYDFMNLTNPAIPRQERIKIKTWTRTAAPYFFESYVSGRHFFNELIQKCGAYGNTIGTQTKF